MDVPVQYFQSVIGIELAVSGALLCPQDESEGNPKPRVGKRLALAPSRVRLEEANLPLPESELLRSRLLSVALVARFS